MFPYWQLFTEILMATIINMEEQEIEKEDELNELKERVLKLEKRVRQLESNDETIISVLKKVLEFSTEMKHPATRMVVIVSMVISTLLNQLPTILTFIGL
jgi:hypothetical protein